MLSRTRRNATQAAIRAGYSPKTAHVIGLENLRKPVIASLLQQKQTVIAERQDQRLAANLLAQGTPDEASGNATRSATMQRRPAPRFRSRRSSG